MSDLLKKIKNNRTLIISLIYIVITGGINLYAYFNLPDRMATQISLSGEKVNTMPTPLYLSGVFVAVLVISTIYLKVEKERKIKLLLVDSLIVVANIVMIVIQL